MKTPKPLSPAEAEAAVKQWNATTPPGTKVRYWPGAVNDVPGKEGVTLTRASLICGTPVVWLKGYGSSVALSHIKVLEGKILK